MTDKKVICAVIKNGTEGNDVCALMSGAPASTAFPGCWEITENAPEVTDRISGVINEFIEAPVFDRVIFGCSEAAAEDIIGKINADVKRITASELAMYI